MGAMMPNVFNPAAQIRVARPGHEQQPGIVIDDMFAAPASWRVAARADQGRTGKMLSAGVAESGPPPAAYVAGNRPPYEQIAATNRGLIRRSHALHCATIAAGAALLADSVNGRLSINSLLFDTVR